MDHPSPRPLSRFRERLLRLLPLPFLVLGAGIALQRIFPEDPRAGSALAGLFVAAGVVVVVAAVRGDRRDRRAAAARARQPAAIIDQESGLGNRIQLEEILIHEMSRSRRHGRPSTLAIFDLAVAGFHPGVPGELPPSPVRHVARFLIDAVRESDYVLRLDGTKFAVLFTESEVESVEAVIERLRTRLSLKAYARNADGTGVFVRSCAGLAEWQPAFEEPEQYLAAALANLEHTRVGYEAAQAYFRGGRASA